MHHFRLCILSAVCCLCPLLSRGQEKPAVEVGTSLEVMSNYVWRGLATGHPFAAAALDLGWHGLAAEAYGLSGLGLGGDLKEIDFSLSYTLGGLSIGVNDYWDTNASVPYFNFRKQETGHVLEAFLSYDFGPLSAGWYTHVAGNDWREDGSRGWSSYFEVKSAEVELASCNWQLQLGITPWASDYYGTKGFAVCNAGIGVSKNLIETELFTLPLVLQLTANPATRNLYFIIGFRLTTL